MSELRRLGDALRDHPARAWLDGAVRRPERIAVSFASAARRAGRGELAGAPGWSADEAARVLLLAALPPDRLGPVIEELYRQGDPEEKRLILKALPLLPEAGPGLPLLRDALRTNDPRLVAAALGPCSHALDQESWRQAVLKCVFMAIPLSVVDGLTGRADAELARMLAAFADERTAAGRAVPADAAALLDSLIPRET